MPSHFYHFGLRRISGFFNLLPVNIVLRGCVQNQRKLPYSPAAHSFDRHLLRKHVLDRLSRHLNIMSDDLKNKFRDKQGHI